MGQVMPRAPHRLIAKLNAECFGTDDWYSDPENVRVYLSHSKNGYLLTRHHGVVVGYFLYEEYQHHFECKRRGVLKIARGKRIGIRLTRRMMQVAKAAGKSYWTYAAVDNLPSINSSIRAGLTVYRITRDWCELVWRPKPSDAL